MKSTSETLLAEFHALANPKKAAILAWFFKTGKGEYGEGDTFLGITVPQTRAVVKQFATDCTLEDAKKLLTNAYHEIRLAGVLFLVYFVEKKIYSVREVAECYLHNPWINNWDIVDVSSPQIIGPYLHSLSKKAREEFVQNCVESPSLWINRIIVLASFYDIKSGNSQLTLFLAEKFLHHKHDLMHKAVGWMLREVGKRCSIDELRGFLDKHASKMPRTMLRYAIEKMNEWERKKYLTK